MGLVSNIKQRIKDYKFFKEQENIIFSKLGIRGNSAETAIYDIDFLKQSDLTPGDYKKLVDIYTNEIVADIEKNGKRELFPKDEKSYSISDSIVGLSREDIEEKILETFKSIQFNKKVDWKKEQAVCSQVFKKIRDLLIVYGKEELLNNSDYIKLEIKADIDKDRYGSIKYEDKLPSEEEISKRVYLSQHFSEDEISKYKNLELLKKRYMGILETNLSTQEQESIREKIENIDRLLSADVGTSDLSDISETMEDLYFEYEVDNRSTLINNLYSPQSDVVINDEADLSSMLVHFFTDGRDMSRFGDKYRKQIEDRILARTGKRSLEELTDYEREEIEVAMKDFYDVKTDVAIVNSTANMAMAGSNGIAYSVKSNVSNQISASVVKKDVLRDRGITVGIGFDSTGLPIENIATISSTNIYSNQGLENVPSTNEFRVFSASAKDMLGDDRKGERNEVVMFRNTEEATLKPSYFLCNCNLDMNDEMVKKEIEEYREFAHSHGLKFVLIDSYSINKSREEKYKKERNEVSIER